MLNPRWPRCAPTEGAPARPAPMRSPPGIHGEQTVPLCGAAKGAHRRAGAYAFSACGGGLQREHQSQEHERTPIMQREPQEKPPHSSPSGPYLPSAPRISSLASFHPLRLIPPSGRDRRKGKGVTSSERVKNSEAAGALLSRALALRPVMPVNPPPAVIPLSEACEPCLYAEAQGEMAGIVQVKVGDGAGSWTDVREGGKEERRAGPDKDRLCSPARPLRVCPATPSDGAAAGCPWKLRHEVIQASEPCALKQTS
ncbi:hypothetical protein AAFF_G00359210 [Aldrovandia affinis]|uniref:Uncharacterized protein n=1 Tax=Aldrovandia affinis TaxID=143900 RepID=A0AAD7WNB2_9TELE|nr:hypothetical protein AAFF_G00359210 [Aldrovandia affinis]